MIYFLSVSHLYPLNGCSHIPSLELQHYSHSTCHEALYHDSLYPDHRARLKIINTDSEEAL